MHHPFPLQLVSFIPESLFSTTVKMPSTTRHHTGTTSGSSGAVKPSSKGKKTGDANGRAQETRELEKELVNSGKGSKKTSSSSNRCISKSIDSGLTPEKWAKGDANARAANKNFLEEILDRQDERNERNGTSKATGTIR